MSNRESTSKPKLELLNALANGWTLAQVRANIAHSSEASNALKALHQAVWGRPIDAAYLAYCTQN